jgi:hypothetical protein
MPPRRKEDDETDVRRLVKEIHRATTSSLDPVRDDDDGIPYNPHPSTRSRAAVVTDSWAKSQKQALRWIGGALATACLGWGIWATNSIHAQEVAIAKSETRQDDVRQRLDRMEQTLNDIRNAVRKP